MPNNGTAKTASGRKRLFRHLAIIGGGLALAVAAIVGFGHSSYRLLTVHGRQYRLSEVSTDATRTLGLSNRLDLPANRGMLFVYPAPGMYCFWMKDMHFSLDMVWTDSAKRVVYLQTDVAPRTYPHSFCPGQPARYVIELNAGQARAAGIRMGDTLSF